MFESAVFACFFQFCWLCIPFERGMKDILLKRCNNLLLVVLKVEVSSREASKTSLVIKGKIPGKILTNITCHCVQLYAAMCQKVPILLKISAIFLTKTPQ